MIIRPARTQDMPAIQHVIRTCYDEYAFTWDPEDYHADLYDLNAHYLEPGHRFWVLEGEQVVGTAALVFHPRIPGSLGSLNEVDGLNRIAGTQASLERLYLLPEARGQGQGMRMLETVIVAAKENGVTHLEIWSDKKLTLAHVLYQRAGATLAGDRQLDDPDQSYEWGFLLTL